MYNTYLLPVYDANDGFVYIDHISAVDYANAEEKFISEYINQYELSETILDFEELQKVMWETKQINLGDIYDKDEF